MVDGMPKTEKTQKSYETSMSLCAHSPIGFIAYFAYQRQLITERFRKFGNIAECFWRKRNYFFFEGSSEIHLDFISTLQRRLLMINCTIARSIKAILSRRSCGMGASFRNFSRKLIRIVHHWKREMKISKKGITCRVPCGRFWHERGWGRRENRC